MLGDLTTMRSLEKNLWALRKRWITAALGVMRATTVLIVVNSLSTLRSPLCIQMIFKPRVNRPLRLMGA